MKPARPAPGQWGQAESTRNHLPATGQAYTAVLPAAWATPVPVATSLMVSVPAPKTCMEFAAAPLMTMADMPARLTGSLTLSAAVATVLMRLTDAVKA